MPTDGTIPPLGNAQFALVRDDYFPALIVENGVVTYCDESNVYMAMRTGSTSMVQGAELTVIHAIFNYTFDRLIAAGIKPHVWEGAVREGYSELYTAINSIPGMQTFRTKVDDPPGIMDITVEGSSKLHCLVGAVCELNGTISQKWTMAIKMAQAGDDDLMSVNSGKLFIRLTCGEVNMLGEESKQLAKLIKDYVKLGN